MNATPVRRILALMQNPLRDSLAARVIICAGRLLGITNRGGAVAQRAAWWSTAIVASLLTAGGCLIIVPGEEATSRHLYTAGRQPSDSRVSWELAIEHGFPFVYLIRSLHELDDVGNYTVTRGPYDAWRLTDRVTEFRIFALAADVLLAFGVVALLTIWWARWRRRRSPTRSAIVGLTVVALLLGPVGVWCQRQRAANRELLTRLDAMIRTSEPDGQAMGVGNWARTVEPGFSDDSGPPVAFIVGPAPSGPLPLVPRLPLWLRELVGDERLLPLGINQPDWSTVQWQADDEVGRLLAGWRPGRIEFGWRTALFEPWGGPNEVPDMNSMSGLEHLTVPADFPADLPILIATDGSAWTSDSSVAFVEKLTNLRSLLLGDDGLTDATLARLKGLRSLETLEIGGGEFTGEGLMNLAGMRHLRLLSLPRVHLTDAGLAAICKLDSLEELEFNGSRLTSAGLPALSALRNLKRLVIRGLHAHGDDLRFLSNLTQLEQLSLALIVTEGNVLQPLRNLRNLRSLNFFWSTFRDDDLQTLQPMPQLERLEIGLSCVTIRGVRNLKAFPNLRNLSLTGLDIGDEAVPELAELPLLASVDVGATKLTNAGKSRLGALNPGLEISDR